MVSPNWPFTASASADSLEASTPLELRSSSYQPTSCLVVTGWEVKRGSEAAAPLYSPCGAHLSPAPCPAPHLAQQGLEHEHAHAPPQLLTHVVERVRLRLAGRVGGMWPWLGRRGHSTLPCPQARAEQEPDPAAHPRLPHPTHPPRAWKSAATTAPTPMPTNTSDHLMAPDLRASGSGL